MDINFEPTRKRGSFLNTEPQLDHSQQDIERAIVEKGLTIFQNMESDKKSLFNKDWWYGQIMEWSMKNEDFKTQMFRFVDVLPYLNTGSEVAKHLKEYFAEKGELPPVFNVGLGMGSLAPGLLAGAVKKNVSQMAKMFITGETPKDALPVLRKARDKNMCFTVDLLGEATLSEKEALDYQNRYIEIINDLTKDSSGWSHNSQIDEDERGPIPKVNISVKITSLYSQIKDTAWEQSIERIKERLRPIFYLAKERNVFVNIDMEHYALKDLTLQVFEEIICEEDFASYPHWGIVIQAYLKDSLTDVHKLIELGKKRGVPFTVRLVKGAYWDYELIHASQENWPVPVYTIKKQSDKNYEDCARTLIENHEHTRLAIGSHNVRSIAACLVMAEKAGLPTNAVEVQMLYGMAEPIKNSLIKQGYRLREYATVGELIPGMAYLVRRLLENTSNESFLRSKFADDVDSTELLKNPAEEVAKVLKEQQLHPGSAETSEVDSAEDKFKNEALLDFAIAENRHNMLKALSEVRKNLGKTYSVVVDGKDLKSDKVIERFNPSDTSEKISGVYAANTEMTDKAVASAKNAFHKWNTTPAEERATLLDRLADKMVAERFNLAALEVFEVGKTWKEADGDICEAVDFCRFYAREMRKMSTGEKVGSAKGEVSLYNYEPRGVCAVIAPWNFPLAILTGMVAGALVTGNTVVMKPAEQSSATAAQLMRMMKEVGFPTDVCHFLPGYGEEVGQHLLDHKDVVIIAFTGSMEVGTHIVKTASELNPDQRYIKKCIIEMGGKNAVIVDSDADLDEAVQGVLYSAFGFQGQKCSACSRAIVLESNYDRFVTRFLDAAASINVLSAENPQAFMGPVVDSEAFEKINGMIERAKTYSKVAFQSEVPSGGNFIPATVFVDVPTDSEIAQKEVFGPVLAIIKVKDIDEAIEVANDTRFGLTGGIYSRSPANIERASRDVKVGNFYVNRSITGAMVERHPFGGFKMSGLGSKTGGPDYLKQFMDPRVVTENTMRRGFAPES